jgi:hypothetical protein
MYVVLNYIGDLVWSFVRFYTPCVRRVWGDPCVSGATPLHGTENAGVTYCVHRLTNGVLVVLDRAAIAGAVGAEEGGSGVDGLTPIDPATRGEKRGCSQAVLLKCCEFGMEMLRQWSRVLKSGVFCSTNCATRRLCP